MTLYLIYIFMTFFLSFLYDRKEDSHGKRVMYALVYVYIVLLSGLRYSVGGDTQFYMADFADVPFFVDEWGDYIREKIVLSGYMPGWSIVNLFSKRMFDSFYAVQFIQSIIVNGCIFFIFRKYTKHIFLCALLYGLSGQFFNLNTEVMREGIAVGICCVGMYNYLRGRKWIFLLMVAIAVTFHVSAAIVLLFPIVPNIQISWQSILYAICISFCLWVISDIIMSSLPEILAGKSRVFTKILLYSSQKNNIFGYIVTTFNYLVCQAGIMYVSYISIDSEDERKNDFSRFIGFFLFLGVLGCAFTGFSRFMNYVVVIYLILLTEFIYHFFSQTSLPALIKAFLLSGVIFFTCLFYFIHWPETNRYHYEFFVPYTSIADEKEVDVSYREEMHIEAITTNRTRKTPAND